MARGAEEALHLRGEARRCCLRCEHKAVDATEALGVKVDCGQLVHTLTEAELLILFEIHLEELDAPRRVILSFAGEAFVRWGDSLTRATPWRKEFDNSQPIESLHRIVEALRLEDGRPHTEAHACA